MTNSNWTGRCPRTLNEALGCSGHAIEIYRTPPLRRFFYGCIRHGWMAFVVLLAVLVLSGCVDMQTEDASAASLRDALAQAQCLKEKP